MFWLSSLKLALFFLFIIRAYLLSINLHSTEKTFKDSSLNKNTSSNENKILINEIRILGNEKTRDETILKELNFDLSKPVSNEDLKFFESRILGLGLFNQVKVFVASENEKNVLYILVQEAWYIWPLPFIDITDRDWKKITYGLNLGIQNLTGRNETLNTGFSLGYDPKFYLSYFNPNLSYKDNLIFRINTSLQKKRNRSLRALAYDNKSYDEKYFNFEIGLGKRLNIFNSIFASLSYEYLQVENYFPLRTVSNSGIDRFVSLQLNYTYDSRDFSAYPKSGSNFNFSYRKVGLGESKVDFNILAFETKKIFPLGNFIFFFRNYSRILSGPELPYYANSFLGYRERLRGYFNDVFESNSMTLNNFEFRIPLVEKFILQFDFPVIPKELITYNFSVDIHFFFDNAFLFDKNQQLKKTKAINGLGFGFSFLFLPYRSLNLELAWNQQFKHQFIFDLNFPF